MVHVRNVRMLVRNGLVPMRMGMRFRYDTHVVMPMVLVVDVRMIVFNCLVSVAMRMAFTEERRNTGDHARGRQSRRP